VINLRATDGPIAPSHRSNSTDWACGQRLIKVVTPNIALPSDIRGAYETDTYLTKL